MSDYSQWMGFQPGMTWQHKRRPEIRMGVVRVEGDQVVCQRVGIPVEEGDCPPWPIKDFLAKYELTVESQSGSARS